MDLETLTRFASKIELGPAPAHQPDLGPCWLWRCAAGHPFDRVYERKDGRGTMRYCGRCRREDQRRRRALAGRS